MTTACRSDGAGRRPPPPRLVRTAHRGLRLTYSLPRTPTRAEPGAQSDDPATWLDDACAWAAARLGTFDLVPREPCLVRLHPSVASFVTSSGQTDDWLRAWASYATVDVLDPSYWRDDSKRARRQRLAHELTHCALYQLCGDERRARETRLPRWFSEGAASVVADQLDRRMPLDLVVRRAKGRVPIGSERAFVDDHLLAYGAAHHAAQHLAKRFGPAVFGELTGNAAEVGGRGSLDRALLERTRLDVEALWRSTVEAAEGT